MSDKIINKNHNRVQVSTAKGMRDIFGDDLKKMNNIREVAAIIASQNNFMNLETPIVEEKALFAKNLGDETEVVAKEIFDVLGGGTAALKKMCESLGDDGNGEGFTALALRPEFTASVVRFLMQHNREFPSPQKLFSCGPVFRHDRPQFGRYRQFNQLNFEIFGSDTLECDVYCVNLAWQVLKGCGAIGKIKLHVNFLGCAETMKSYAGALTEYFKVHEASLSDDSRKKIASNPLRILDSKDGGDKKIVLNAPKIQSHYTYEYAQRVKDTIAMISEIGIDFEIDSNLVRGLDYYNGIVWEFVMTDANSSQNTVLGGGRYNNLMGMVSCGKISTPAIGFAAGIERLAMICKPPEESEETTIGIVAVGKHLFAGAILLANRFSNLKVGKSEVIFVTDGVTKGIKKAQKLGCTHICIFGEKEKSATTLSDEELLKLTKEGADNCLIKSL